MPMTPSRPTSQPAAVVILNSAPGRGWPVRLSRFCTINWPNAPDGTLLIRKVCSVNPSVTLQNAEFKVAYADGSVVGDSNGI